MLHTAYGGSKNADNTPTACTCDACKNWILDGNNWDRNIPDSPSTPGLELDPGSDTTVVVVVEGPCPGTAWSMKVGCAY